jgi:hypothetical protein
MVVTATTTDLIHEDGEIINWNAIVPLIFVERQRFIQTGKRRYAVKHGDQWAGIAVAWKPPGYDNYGLNCADLELLLEKQRGGSINAAFVVLAQYENGEVSYVAHREAEAVRELLKDEPPRDGPHGRYWLLRDFAELEILAEALKRF